MSSHSIPFSEALSLTLSQWGPVTDQDNITQSSFPVPPEQAALATQSTTTALDPCLENTTATAHLGYQARLPC